MPDFLANALLAGTFVALACGLVGWFAVARAQVFAGDALSHVAFTGAIAAAAAGVDVRIGLFGATVAVGLGLGLLGGGEGAGSGSAGGGSAGAGSAATPVGGVRRGTARLARLMRVPVGRARADDVTIGVVFVWALGIGVLLLSLNATASGITGAHTLFGSIFGLGRAEAVTSAAVAVAIVALIAAVARPLLFATLDPVVAGIRGVPVAALGLAFLALLGATAAEATQAVGALLLLGLIAAPAGAAHRLCRSPLAGIALSGALAVAAMWAGLGVSYAVPSLPPSSAVIAFAAGAYLLSLAVVRPGGRARSATRLTP